MFLGKDWKMVPSTLIWGPKTCTNLVQSSSSTLSPHFVQLSTGSKLNWECMSMIKVNTNEKCWTFLCALLIEWHNTAFVFFNCRGQVWWRMQWQWWWWCSYWQEATNQTQVEPYYSQFSERASDAPMETTGCNVHVDEWSTPWHGHSGHFPLCRGGH